MNEEDNITTIGGVTNLTRYFVTKTSVNIEEFLNEMKHSRGNVDKLVIMTTY